MDVAFYHDDPSSRIASAYDPQSSPGSVDSISSTDGGPVCAIAAVPPAFREQRFGQEFAKSNVLKGMNLGVESGTTYSANQQQVGFLPNPNVVSTQSYHQSNNYEQSVVSSSVGSTSANNLSLNISDSGVLSNSNTITTPDLVNMLKVGSPDFDQMLMQYSQAGTQMTPQAYSRSLAQEQEMYAQNYARELARQKNHNGGSNSDIAGSNPTETTQHTAITTGASTLPHPHQYVSPDTYYRGDHNEGPSSSVFSAAGTTVHHIGASLTHRQVGHSVMSPHSSLLGQMKEELPQTVPVIPNTRSMSPIDMEHQEVIKTERKRMRNRLAASKCRKRKLERISRLEEKVNGLKNQNLELSSNANVLRQQVAELKSKVMAHVNSGCQLMMSQQQVTF